ncbi:MAG TPA: helix-turn-helix transcriptional regulator [Micromonosporaceae bacterium]|nr:helix-turn-helix transcriptional regulator [Micromonosporaceae bacterium]
MTRKYGPTLRSRWLGRQLREYREAAGLTLRDAAEHVLRNAPAIGRMEAGFVPARAPDVFELLNLYGVTDQGVRAGLEQLSRDAWRKRWWDSYTGWLSPEFVDLAWLETRTTRIRDFSTLVLHGLLHTPEYARALMRASDPDAHDDDLDQLIEFRTRRQEILAGDSAPEYTSIIDEAVLHRVVGGSDIMRAQLRHLLDLADRPRVTLRVLPFAVGTPSSSESPFTYLSIDQPLPDVVPLSTEAGIIYVEAPGTDGFDKAYVRLERDALSPDDSRTFIRKQMEQLA